MQDFAGSSVVHLCGATAALAGTLIIGARLGKFTADGKPRPIPGHSMPMAVHGVIILWFGWFGFNAGSTLAAVGTRFADIATTTTVAAATGVLGAMLAGYFAQRTVDVGLAGNGAIAGLVAITAPCAYVEEWAALVIGAIAGGLMVGTVLLVDRVGVDDPIGAIAAHGVGGIWGTLSCGLFTTAALAETNAVGEAGLFYGGGLHQLGVQATGLVAVGAFTFTASFLVLWLLKRTIGIRTEPEVETLGLDVSEHGMWGYPEFYIPVPGGYGSEHTSVSVGQRFSDREVIVSEGQPGDSMYVIQSGKVEVVKQSEAGDQSMGTLKQGQFFGEMAIFEDEVRSATVRAVGEAHVIEVDKKSVEKRIAENPRLAVNLLKEMSSRLRRSNARRLRGAETPETEG
jgi:hypothetical protein